MKVEALPSAQDLISRLSSDDAGHNNVVVARDWRHLFDDWIRREGDKLFSAAASPSPIESQIAGGIGSGTRTVEKRTRGGTVTLVGYSAFTGPSGTKYKKKVVSGSMDLGEFPVPTCTPAQPVSGGQSGSFPVFFFSNEIVNASVNCRLNSIDPVTGISSYTFIDAQWVPVVPGGYVGTMETHEWAPIYNSTPVSLPHTFSVAAGALFGLGIRIRDGGFGSYGIGSWSYIAGGAVYTDDWDQQFDVESNGSITATIQNTTRTYNWGTVATPVPGSNVLTGRPDLVYQQTHTIVWNTSPVYTVVATPSATVRTTTGLGCIPGLLPWEGGGPSYNGRMLADGEITETLSEADTKADGILRLWETETWSEWETLTVESDAEACYYPESDEFDYSETQIRVSYTGVAPDTSFTLRLQVWRRDLSDDTDEFVEEVVITADSDGSGNLLFEYDLPNVEGFCYFIADGGLTVDGDDPDQLRVTLIFQAQQDNGKVALIVGTPKSLYRYWGLEDNDILEDDIVEPDIVGTICNGYWLRIGSNFTVLNCHRWEAKNINGYAIFNNGIDLPVSYHLNEFAVKPIHELREQGVSYVGTILEVAGIPVFADIGEIVSDFLQAVMELVGYGGFANGQEHAINRVHYDVWWGDPVSPLRWGASVPGSMTAGSRYLTLLYAVESLTMGQEIRVNGAGLNGADFITTLLFKSTSLIWVCADKAETTVALVAVSKRDAAALICGRYPVKDDTSAVVRMCRLGDRFVLAKSDGFVLGEYTGLAAAPFAFQRLYTGEEGLFWRWTLTELNSQLIYAGKDEFFTFDLVERVPRQHPILSLSSDIFFTAVALALQDDVFVANNGHTKELWFVFPSAEGLDKALAYDYHPRLLGGNRCTTVGAAYSAAAMVDRPQSTIAHAPVERWFLAATADGLILQYLFDKTGPLGWQRRGVDYLSSLWSGKSHFTDEDHEKEFHSYLLLLASQSPNTQLTVEFFGGDNANGTFAQLPDSPVTLSNPKVKNQVPLHWLAHLVQERIGVTGSGNVRIRKRRWDVGRQGGVIARV